MCRFKLRRLYLTLRRLHRFNTSYVSVQGGEDGQPLGIMNSFNTSYVSVQELNISYSSFEGACFNTSYVSVQVRNKIYKFRYRISFNTSYVSVQEKKVLVSKDAKIVSIHHMCRFKGPTAKISKVWKDLFQYIICVGSSLYSTLFF